VTTLRGLRRSIARNQSVICRLLGFMAALITEVAPVTSKTRNRSLPAQLIPPHPLLPAGRMFLWCQTGPGGEMRADSNAAGSISITSVSAVTGPTPGIVASRRLTALVLCAAVEFRGVSAERVDQQGALVNQTFAHLQNHALSCVTDFTSPKCIPGRLVTSQMASVSLRLFLARLT
jgi:hypothetical protein